MVKKKRKSRRKSISTGRMKFLLCIAILLIAGTYFYQRSGSITVESGDQIQVIDVSKWNEKISWKKVKKANIYYAMLRIGHGKDKRHSLKEDSYFIRNYRSGKSYHIKMGVYFYAYATTVEGAQEEARFCLKLLKKYHIKPDDLALPVAYDVEDRSILHTGRNNVTAMTVAFCEEIKKAGYTPMVYSSASALLKYFKHSSIKDYKIWVAHYGVEDRGPRYPYHYDMWQYTDTAIVPGANTSGEDDKGYCDMNYYIVE